MLISNVHFAPTEENLEIMKALLDKDSNDVTDYVKPLTEVAQHIINTSLQKRDIQAVSNEELQSLRRIATAAFLGSRQEIRNFFTQLARPYEPGHYIVGYGLQVIQRAGEVKQDARNKLHTGLPLKDSLLGKNLNVDLDVGYFAKREADKQADKLESNPQSLVLQ